MSTAALHQATGPVAGRVERGLTHAVWPVGRAAGRNELLRCWRFRVRPLDLGSQDSTLLPWGQPQATEFTTAIMWLDGHWHIVSLKRCIICGVCRGEFAWMRFCFLSFFFLVFTLILLLAAFFFLVTWRRASQHRVCDGSGSASVHDAVGAVLVSSSLGFQAPCFAALVISLGPLEMKWGSHAMLYLFFFFHLTDVDSSG